MFLLHFVFCGTCEEHAGLLHRYIHDNVVFYLHHHHLYLAFLPMLSLPDLLTPRYLSLGIPQQTSVHDAPLPVSMCSHCSTPAYKWEHMVFDFLFLCSFAKNDCFQVHSCPYKGYKLIIFYGCIVFHAVYVPHFSCPVYHWWVCGLFQVFAIVKLPQWTYMCICLYNRTIYNSLYIYPVIWLAGQMEFLFLGPWGIATLSSTMVELIYNPTNGVKVLLFLHILSSICCL